MSWIIREVRDVVFGVDARKETGKKLREYGCSKIVILHDEITEPLGYLSELEGIISAENIETLSYRAPSGEPSSREIDAFVEFFKSNDADGIVALGGGSTIDRAKMAGKVLANGGVTTDYLEGYTTAFTKGRKRFNPIIGMPTTGGTGAEVCWGIMCVNENNGIKTYAVNPCTMGIVDPAYSLSMPPEVTAFTGMDAVAQCAESLCNSLAFPNLMVDLWCKEGMQVGIKYLPAAIKDPGDLKAREMMSWAALLSGYVLNIRKTHAGHAIANQISDAYHLPHGVGVGCGLAAQVRYIAKCEPEIVKIWAPAFGIDTAEESSLPGRLITAVDDFQRSINFKSMKQLGIPEEFCDTIADNIAKDTKWKVVPNPPDFELLRVCLHEAWDY